MKTFAMAMLGAALVLPTVAHADQGDILVRGRIAYVKPDVKSKLSNLDVKDDTIPELDFSYFVHKNAAVELILGTSRHEVTLGGASLGKVSVLPPTLTVQYHPTPEATVRPYFGAGLNYTRFYRIGLANGALTIDKNSFGPALQAGLDISIDKRSFVNFDAKKIWMKTDVKDSAGSTVTELKLDPYVLSVGYGWRF
ncbi:OmpW family outer membrane protein [Chitinivorax sp. PXF-14]|uniref:OmpW/AlkL family protein n=1 Tax=Chitinivorax sp. PXF-14 TaxID=3230488 RepID=UPI0034659B36